VLAVVEQQQQVLPAQVVGERGDRRLARHQLEPDRPDDLLHDEDGLAQGGELDQPRPVGVLARDLARDVQRQAGLAGAADADERDETVRAQQAADLGRLALPPDERGQVGRQVGRRVARAEGRERRVEAGCGELVHVLGPCDVPQVVLAPVEQRGAGREAAARERRARRRHQHLSAMADREQPRNAVERRPEVVVVADLGLAGVDRHP